MLLLRFRLVDRAMATIAVTALLTACGGSGSPHSATSTHEPKVLFSVTPAPTPRNVSARIPVDLAPDNLAAGFGSVWVSNHHGEDLSRIDPATDKVTAKVHTGDESGGVAIGDGAVWVLIYSNDKIVRVDPSTNARTTYSTGPGPTSGWPAFGFGSIWVGHNRYISRLDPKSLHVEQEIRGFSFPVIEHGALWASREPGNQLVRLDPTSGRVIETLNANGFLGPQSFASGSLWIGKGAPDSFNPGKLLRLDPSTGRVTASVKVGASPWAVSGDGAIWVYNQDDGTVMRVDPKTLKKTTVTATGEFNAGQLIVAFGSVWVTGFDQNVVYRVEEK